MVYCSKQRSKLSLSLQGHRLGEVKVKVKDGLLRGRNIGTGLFRRPGLVITVNNALEEIKILVSPTCQSQMPCIHFEGRGGVTRTSESG